MDFHRFTPLNPQSAIRNPDKDIKVIGRELGVSFILGGSVRKIENDIRITAQLIKAKTGNHVWADTYDGKYTEKLFEFQGDVAKRVANSLKAVLTKEEMQRIGKNPTANLAAHDLYLKANNFLNKYIETRDLSSYHTAINLYKSVLELDSAYARDYTGLAGAYFIRYQWDDLFKGNYVGSVRTLAERALLIDDQLDEAYYLRGKYFKENGQIEEALLNYDKALEINPNLSPSIYDIGYIYLLVKNDYVKGLKNIHKYLDLCYGPER